jgi:L-methionine (R)-S-oxide reductase
MTESIAFSRSVDRRTLYAEVAPQIEALLAGESDMVANLANIAAVLKEAFDFLWVGFYLAKDGELVLGPFQGPVACTRIGFDQGVCGHAYTTRKTVVVPNVDEFPGHIACASEARSEIVVPIFGRDREVFGVLDIDSDRQGDFSETDRHGLGRIVKIIERFIQGHTIPARTG